MSAQFKHKTVLLDEAVELLISNPDGVYFDGTFGRGGHSKLILGLISAEGKLLASDKDPEAEQVGEQLAEADPRFQIFRGSFADIADYCQRAQVQLDGALLDLGVSSPQLDDAERGFSFMQDGPLDMRMNPDVGESAAEWINSADEKEIADVLWQYGEEKYSRRMARAIVTRRAETPFSRTGDLAAVIKEANPNWEKNKHPATRAFQGIRIFINRELEDLNQFLHQVMDCLKPGGRLVVISFHSLEDRMVKRFIQKEEKGDLPADLPVTADQVVRRLKRVGKALKPTSAEVESNPRARSAVMRIAERV